MATLEIINAEKKKIGEAALADSVMKDKVNKAVLYQAVRQHLASKHHGTVRTKTRAEVLRTTKKVYKQKGTGNARHGSMKSSPFVGGGRVFGPKPRDYAFSLPKKVKRLAIREALKSQIQGGNVSILEDLNFKEIKTKKAAELFGKLGFTKGLVILDKKVDAVEKSIRNLKNFKTVRADQMNVHDILKFPRLIFTSSSFSQISQSYLA